MSVARRTRPQVDGDFYGMHALLSADDQALLQQVRTFLEREVTPIINHYWTREEFPHQLIPGLAALKSSGLSYQGYGCPGKSVLLDGFVAMELARVDSSIATFMGVHSGLAMGAIYLCGSEEQKQHWLPSMARMEMIGAFGLTEPEVGRFRWVADYRPARGRYLVSQRPEEMDRQRHLCRCDGHLGSRPG